MHFLISGSELFIEGQTVDETKLLNLRFCDSDGQDFTYVLNEANAHRFLVSVKAPLVGRQYSFTDIYSSTGVFGFIAFVDEAQICIEVIAEDIGQDIWTQDQYFSYPAWQRFVNLLVEIYGPLEFSTFDLNDADWVAFITGLELD